MKKINLLRHSQLFYELVDKVGLEQLKKLARDELTLVELNKPESISEEPSLFSEENPEGNKGPNFEIIPELSEPLIVKINKEAKLPYPEGSKVLAKELEKFGLEEYDVSKQVVPWFHIGQHRKNGEKGQVIYDYLLEQGELQDHLGLADLVAIKQAIKDKGVIPNHELFAPNINMLFGWKSVVHQNHTAHNSGGSYVPYLLNSDIKRRIGWLSLSLTLFGNNPGLKFKERMKIAA